MAENTTASTNNTNKAETKSDIMPFIIITLTIVIPIRFFIVQPFIVQGASMVPTFQNGDYLIVDEISYHFNEPKRGDVIIFKYPKDTSKYFIKRVEGMPGDIVDGKKLPDNQYFVLGDNRNASSDSRIWGSVPRRNIVGRPLVRLLPLGKIDLFPGKTQ
ncbi:MAG TPA: signal peptidase I [Candidatus Paceibacterota bacterium]